MLSLFPQTKFNEGKPIEQLEQILEEVGEARHEFQVNDRSKALMETLDIVQASIGVLYAAGYTPAEIHYGAQALQAKNYARGYYKNEIKND